MNTIEERNPVEATEQGTAQTVEQYTDDMEQRAQQAELFAQLDGVEDESLRDEYTKHFHLGGNRFQAVSYAEPVHFYDSDKRQWREIDNELEEFVDDNKRSVLRNKAGRMRVELTRTFGDGETIKLTDGANEFGWSFANAKNRPKVRIKKGSELRREMLQRLASAARSGRSNVEPSQMSDKELERALTPQELRTNISDRNAQARYDDLAPGMSVQYTLSGGKVKEDIILENQEALQYAVIKLPKTYDYVVNTDQSVSVRKVATEEETFQIEPPYIYDSDGAVTLGKVQLTDDDKFVLMHYVIDDSFMANAAFPVTIDPVIIPSHQANQGNIRDTTLNQADPNSTTAGTNGALRVGYLDNNKSKENIALLRALKLVKQRASDTIIYAGLEVAPYEDYNSSEYVGAYRVKYLWSEGKATWTTPAVNADDSVLSGVKVDDFIDTQLLDYISATNVKPMRFDITNLYRSWYKLDANGQNTNFGIALRHPKGVQTGSNYVKIESKENNAYLPKFVVNYVSHAGLKGRWQYESLSVGRAGTINVDLYNGNAVVAHPDTAMDGIRVPVSITHYYNSCMSSSNDVYCGNGWRTSLNQSVRSEKLNSTTDYAVWRDGEGTDHYFKKEGSQPYEDDEGMGYKLSSTSTKVEIEDKGHNTLVFHPTSAAEKGQLARIVDAKQNKTVINYTNAKLTSVVDAAGRTTTYEYNSACLLSKITAVGCPVVSYEYDSGNRLIKVRYGDLQTSQETVYTYDGTSNMLTSAKNYDGTIVEVSYEAEQRFNQSAIEEYAAQARWVTSMEQKNGAMLGAKLSFEYLDMQTIVTVADTGAGKKLTYLFNDVGNVVCVKDELGFAQYTRYKGAPTNSPAQISKLQKAVINRMKAIDTHTDWTTVPGSTASKITRETGNTCLGLETIKFVQASSGAESKVTQAVTLEGGKDWTYSAYVRNESSTPVAGCAFLRFKLPNGSIIESQKIKESTTEISSGPAADGWERISITAKNVTAGTATVEMVAGPGAGTFWMGAPQLEEGLVANQVNQLVNGDFRATRIASSGRILPLDWEGGTGISEDSNSTIVPGAAKPGALGGNVLQLTSVPDRSSVAFSQVVYTRGAKDDVMVIGGWINAQSAATSESHVGFVIDFENGGSFGNRQYFHAPREWSGWQFVCFPVVAPVSYTAVKVYVNYSYNANTAYFTNVFLYREVFGRSYAYDNKKNVTSVSTLSAKKSGKKYDDYDNLIEYRQPGAPSDAKYIMNYANGTEALKKMHLMKDSATPMGVKTFFTYHENAFYNPKQTVVAKTKDGTDSKIYSETGYDANGNYVTSQTNSRGKTSTQQVDANKGTVTWAKNAAQQQVNYTYDAAKRMTSVQATADGKTYRNDYTYDKDRLKTAAHNTSGSTSDVVYTFEYDALGAQTKVSVGNQVLSTNVYETGRAHKLEKTVFGNNGQLRYAYDDFDRVIGMSYDSADPYTNPRYHYVYDANGQVSYVMDNHLNRTHQSEYDVAMRPCQATTRDQAGNILYRAALIYDGQNRLLKLKETASSDKHVTAYTYDNDNRATMIRFNDNTLKVEYAYDSGSRLTQRKLTNGTHVSTATYGFMAGGSQFANSTTAIVQTITQPGLTLNYTYDDVGNILSETKNSSATTYQYDKLGQLTRVNDPHEGATWTYAYDNGGNLLTKKMYAYTTGTPGTAMQTMNYAYDATWKDKLQSYSGKSISYDAIGNPTSYDGWSYTWVAGRKLSKMTKSGMTVDYAYDVNGLRTQKKVTQGSTVTTTDYLLHGKLVMELRQGTQTLHFYYDKDSRPTMVAYKTTATGSFVHYTYQHNLQGDIVAILDASGTKVVEYHYDAWGRKVAVTGSMATTLGKLNPFRYRGYVYDEETGLYHLRSRYYNPEWCRFINEDSLIGKTGAILSHNVFAYCKNSPIVFSDPSGHAEKRAWYADIVEWVANLVPSISNKLNSRTYGEDEKTLALNHPLAAITANEYSEIAGSATDRIFGSGATNMDGTLANAFKHAYWNALMTYGIGSSLAERFANAHEESLRSQWGDEYLGTTIGTHSKMDYYYNALGRGIGSQKFPDNMATNHLIAKAVLSAVIADTSNVLIWDCGFTVVDDLGLGH